MYTDYVHRITLSLFYERLSHNLFAYLSECFFSQFKSTLIHFFKKSRSCKLYFPTIQINFLTKLLPDLHRLASSSFKHRQIITMGTDLKDNFIQCR